MTAGLLLLTGAEGGDDLWASSAPLWSLVRDLVGRYGYLGGFLLIYVEESGIPLFVPGDVFLVYVGHRLPANAWAWLAAWAGFVVVVVLGAANLFLLSRRVGRKALSHPLARFLHLTPERLGRAEAGFRRWGPWAIIFGRHVPGMRVPITVAAGILGMDLRLFLVCVAISSAAWAALFLTLGMAYGESITVLLHSPATYGGFMLLAAVGAIWFFRKRLWRRATTEVSSNLTGADRLPCRTCLQGRSVLEGGQRFAHPDRDDEPG